MRTSPRRGAAAIEFALCASALFGILFATLDWGWWFYRRAQVLQATGEATRQAATLPQSSDPASTASTYVIENLEAQGISTTAVSIPATQSGTSPSEVLEVSVSLPFEPLLGLWPAPSTLSAVRSTYLERQD